MPRLLAFLARAAEVLPARFDPAVAGLCGRLWCATDRRRQRAVRANRAALDARFPLHRPFTSYVLAFLGWLRLLRLTPAGVRERTRIEGLEPVRHAARSRTGAIVVAAHVGDWEWGAAALAATGLRVVVVANRQMRERWTPALQAAKARLGIEVVPPGAAFTRLARALRQGAVLALLVDGDVASARTPAVIAGRACVLPAGPVRLAARLGARLLAGHCERDGDRGPGSYRLRLEPLDSRALAASNPDARRQRLEQALAHWFEGTLRAHAAGWCLFRPFFPAPPGAASTARRQAA